MCSSVASSTFSGSSASSSVSRFSTLRMRTGVSAPLAKRTGGAEIDREARKGKPIPSDHAPLLIDVDEPGVPIDAGWAGGDARTAARRARS